MRVMPYVHSRTLQAVQEEFWMEVEALDHFHALLVRELWVDVMPYVHEEDPEFAVAEVAYEAAQEALATEPWWRRDDDREA
jgi:hypothetical protein